MSIILKGILALFWLLLVPAAIGNSVYVKKKTHLSGSMPAVWISGLIFIDGDIHTSIDFFEGTPSYSDSIVWWGGSTSGSSGSCIGCWK